MGVLAVGLPLFICMPLWVDTTYHDLSARNVLRGGVHYRDIFETNLPGMVWLHALIRPLIGWSSEAIRAVDFAVVGGEITLLCLWLKRIGVPRSGLAWFLAAAFFFYLFETEFIHCQRDGWMLLPTVVAMQLRGRQWARQETAEEGRLYWWAAAEGACWASAVWIKPHAVVPAMFVYLAGVRRTAGASRRIAIHDFLGLLTGGLLVGSAGVSWLVLTGAWPFMWDVLLNWNPEYYKWTPAEMNHRLSMVIMYFRAWSLVQFVALPLGLVALVRARVWRWGPTPGVSPARLDQAALAALYLGWFTEAVFLQKSFHYSQAPVHLLAFALLAAHRWPFAPICIGWCLLGASLNEIRFTRENADRFTAIPGLFRPLVQAGQPLAPWLIEFKSARPFTYQQVVPEHRLFNDNWRMLWWSCLTEGSSPQIKDALSFYNGAHSAPTWTELDEVRRYLETLQLQDGELICWDDTTHPLYLDLNLRPGIRYMHVNTTLDFRSKRPLIRAEVIASGHKYVVSDLAVVNAVYGYFPLQPPSDQPLELPLEFPCVCRGTYPNDQPIVKKIGRYWVHRIDNPIGPIRMPYPLAFDKP